MANELAVIEKNWLTLADQVGNLPAPFEQTIFLTECHLAGTAEIGFVPRRHAAVMARLMDAGKNLSAKVVDKELEGHWLDITVSIEMKEA